jgi:hypothetical protein
MSVDFSAILSHRFDNSDILTVPERLNADRERMGKVTAEYRAFLNQTGHWRFEDQTLWHWEQGRREWKGNDPNDIWNSDDPIGLAGPALLSIYFGRGACDFSAPLRWSVFVKDAAFQLETRKVCYAIVQAFQGDKAIYLPDSASQVSVASEGVYENRSFQQIRYWLKQNIGEPAKTLQALRILVAADNWEGYFIDDFEDLKQ